MRRSSSIGALQIVKIDQDMNPPKLLSSNHGGRYCYGWSHSHISFCITATPKHSPLHIPSICWLYKKLIKQNLSFGRTIIADFLTKKGDRRNSFALISSEAYYRREVKWHQSNELMCNWEKSRRQWVKPISSISGWSSRSQLARFKSTRMWLRRHGNW